MLLALLLASQVPSWIPSADSAFRDIRADAPGCAYGVVEAGRLTHARGFGLANLEHRVPNTPRTAFYIASTSKQFAAAAVALLAEEGKLDLDAPVRRWIPELPDYAAGVTARHLVHHTSAIRDYLSLWSLKGRGFQDAIPLSEALAMIGRQRSLNFEPGGQHLYSNSGYLLLSVLVERVSGQPLSDFTAERFFTPAGMTNTRFRDRRGLPIPDRADGHSMEGGRWQVVRTSFDLVGDGGLVTTVEDLARWEQWFWEDSARARLRDLVLTRGRLARGDSLDYAFGLAHGRYRGVPTVAHAGGFLGFLAEKIRFPAQRTTVMVLCNTFTGDPVRRARRVADAVLAPHLGPPDPAPQPPAPPKTITVDDAALAGLAGEYYSEELLATWTIRADSGRLVASAGEFVARLTPVAPDAFRAAGLDVAFTRENGRVHGMVVSQGRAQGIRFRREGGEERRRGGRGN